MRLWLYGLATVIAGTFAVLLAFAPTPFQKTQARTGSAAQLTAMLQGGGLDVQCDNNRTFCRADVSRCDSNERERQNWRTQCLAPHKQRYEDCLARRDGRAAGRLPHGRILTPKEECKHLANYASTRCQVEPQICPTYRQCEQQFGQCVRDMGAALRDRQSARDNDVYVPAPPRAPDTRPVSPPSRPDTRYQVYVKNGCRKYIEIAYFYEESPGQWAKSGWRGFQPGRVGELKSPIMTRQLGIFSTFGFPEQRFRRGFNNKTSVIDRDFLVPINEPLRGKGARTVPFDMLKWASDISKPVIVIENCGQYEAGVRVKQAQIHNTAEEPKPVLLRVIPSPEADPAQPKVIAVEEPPASVREPMKPAACQEIDRTAMSPADINRYESLEARGMIKLCEAD